MQSIEINYKRLPETLLYLIQSLSFVVWLTANIHPDI